METESFIPNKELIFLSVCLCMQDCKSIIRPLFYVFYQNCVAMETESFIPNKELIFLSVCLCMQDCKSIIRPLFYVFYQNCVNMNVSGVNYRT